MYHHAALLVWISGSFINPKRRNIKMEMIDTEEGICNCLWIMKLLNII